MGATGPIPKRTEERRRRNTTTEAGETLEAEKVEVDAPPAPPLPMNEKWHADAKEFYQACIDSVQSRFYEPSDWAALKMACETQSRLLEKVPVVTTDDNGDTKVEMLRMPIKGADLNGLTKLWSLLMVTEGDRRRLRLEIERKAATPDLPATAEQVVQNRAALFSVK
jgi:hypothetical protein